MKWASTVSSCMVYIEASHHMSQATVMVTHLLNDGSSYRFPVNHFLKWTAGQPKQTAKMELKTNIRNTRLARSKANCKRITLWDIFSVDVYWLWTSSSFNNRLKNKELKKEGSVWVYLIRTTIKSWFSPRTDTCDVEVTWDGRSTVLGQILQLYCWI